MTSTEPTIMASAAEQRGRQTLESIQYLRGIAAVLIVIYHVFPQIERMGYSLLKPYALASGVDVFFVISGFVMVYSSARHPDRGALAFIRDRLIRIAPLYWSLTALMVILLLISPKLAQTSQLEWGHVVASFLFVPWPHPVLHQYWPLLVPGWTLNYEMFFYVLFALSLFVARGRRGRLVTLLCTALLVLTLLPLVVTPTGWLEFYTRSLILEFGFGMLLCEAFLRRPAPTSRWWWLAVVLGGIGLAASPVSVHILPQGLATGGPALLVVLGFLYVPLNLTGWWEQVARKVGDASYSIYLSHYIVMSALGQAWRKLPLPQDLAGYVAFGILATIVCVMVGIGVFHVMERPLTRAARRWVTSRRAREHAVSQNMGVTES